MSIFRGLQFSCEFESPYIGFCLLPMKDYHKLSSMPAITLNLVSKPDIEILDQHIDDDDGVYRV